MYLAELRIENFRMYGDGEQALVIPLRPGLTALVGENDAGKTTVIDALRFALGTTDQDWFRLEDSDFHQGDTKKVIRIVCKFKELNSQDLRTFVEYLTYGDSAKGALPFLCVNWIAEDTGTAPKGRPFRRVELRSGKKGDGPTLSPEVKEMLRATYLRPLRDAESALSAGRGSRLSQVLQRTGDVEKGKDYDKNTALEPSSLNVRGIGDFANALLEEQQGIIQTRDKINDHLNNLSLNGDELKSNIKVSGSTVSEDNRLRQLLEKLDLSLGSGSSGKLGLGSNNLLFMACELLLMAQEDEGSKLLLIEEPEAHLHTQRQLRVMKYLQEQAVKNGVQIIVTTHSPNLASAIDLDNMVMIQNGQAFSLAKENTKLESSDYRFLERFLDVTKANLFFARGVMIVEGDAENILLPTLAKLIGRDFTEYGVSIVNVGGVGLRRYARIFQRRNDDKAAQLSIPVACVTDMDVMPDCGKPIIKKELSTKSALGEAGLKARRSALSDKTNGQKVKTYIANEWTLEYDLAYFGLAKDVYVAAYLAKKDEAIAEQGKDLNAETVTTVEQKALADFKGLEQEALNSTSNGLADGCAYKELLATKVYALFTTGTKASKTIAAQYLAGALEDKKLAPDAWRKILPPYLVEAIDYVTGADDAAPKADS
ncbi:MAG: AAA family ATPase [Gallionella sp.]|jgi:putative ATP-dependent endonuclease of OLD family|nr:AAA family ATPase [Gallionella sp.]MCK9353734.1 AAA family ATPase [Gallionella sp.]